VAPGKAGFLDGKIEEKIQLQEALVVYLLPKVFLDQSSALPQGWEGLGCLSSCWRD